MFPWKMMEGNEGRERRRQFGRWGYRRPKHNIPVNIIERGEEFEVRVHALTFPKDRIKVAVMEDTLYISGKREPQDEAPSFLLQEYPIKSFERSFELSHRVDQAGIRAKYMDGVLVITVPKTQAAMSPEMEIDIE
jgi:HSP20 family protein